MYTYNQPRMAISNRQESGRRMPNRYTYPATVNIHMASGLDEYYQFSDLQEAYIWIRDFIVDPNQNRNYGCDSNEWSDNGEAIKSFIDTANTLDARTRNGQTWVCVADTPIVQMVLYYGHVTHILYQFINGRHTQIITYATNE